MKNYKILVEITTSEKLSKRQLDGICKIIEVATKHKYPKANVRTRRKQDFKIEFERGNILVAEGQNEIEVVEQIAIIYPNKKFKLSEEI